ncbi:MAG TPA: hypothetical protein ENO16_03790 [Chromatiales bacterium]|nr:hypothetical protein [Chromatiales bacterium]
MISLPEASTINGQWQVVALNRGRVDGMAAGNVVRLHRPGNIAKVDNTPIPDPRGGDTGTTAGERVSEVKLPDVELGDAVVFLVYERVSYALLTGVTQEVREGTCFTAPNVPTFACR